MSSRKRKHGIFAVVSEAVEMMETQVRIGLPT